MTALAAKRVAIPADQQNALVHGLSSPESKIALFRSLFRGRDDVYPRRFESRRTGKSGYQPACANEWARGLCEKPRIKCTACSHQRFLPVTDDVIRWHLSGHDDSGRDFVMGVYPLLRDETCFFLAADLDKAAWPEDAQAILETCRRINLAAALERSRSGNGGHIWLFFEQAIPATLAQARRPPADRNDGTPARHRARFLRSLLPQSRHIAPGRFWQLDRAAFTEAAARARQQRLSR